MEQSILKPILLSVIYLYLKDKNISSLEQFEKLEKEIIKDINSFVKKDSKLLHLTDKEAMLNDAISTFKQNIFVEKSLKEKKLFEILDNYLSKYNDNEKQTIFDIVLNFVFLDKKITENETEVVYQLLHHFNLPIDDLKTYVKNKFTEYNKNKKKDKIETNNKSKILPIVALVMLVVGISLFIFALTSKKSKSPVAQMELSNIVYQKVYFDKYIVAGNKYAGDVDENTSATAQKYFGKAVVYYVNGVADVEFNFNDFKLEGTKFIYKGNMPKGFDEILPYKVDVNIPQDNFKFVYEKKPAGISEQTAANFGKTVGVVAAVGGGYLGGKIGSSIGGSLLKFTPIGRIPGLSNLVGGALGGILGAGGAGVTGYLATKKMLTGVQLTKDITNADKEKIQVAAKALIAAEILYDKSLQEKFTKAFEKYVKLYFAQYGINITEFVYTNKSLEG